MVVGGRPAAVATSIRATVLLIFAVILLAAPAEARRQRRTVRHRTVRKTVARPAPAIEPVRNVILFVASGYDAGDWDAARASAPAGFLAMDRMPVSALALPPARGPFDPQRAAWWLSTGAGALIEPPPSTLMALARRRGKSIALVSGGELTDPLPAYLAVPPAVEEGLDTVRRLVSARVEALFARSVPDGLAPGPESYGYHVATEAKDVLMAETTPVLATAPPDAMSFDTLAFRALHLAAKNPRGFFLALGARPATVPATDFNAAVAALRAFTRRNGHTLMLVVICPAVGPYAVFAEGMAAGKFGGTFMVTDIPTIIAGVAGIKEMPRNFSLLYSPRLARSAPPPRGRGIVPLPW